MPSYRKLQMLVFLVSVLTSIVTIAEPAAYVMPLVPVAPTIYQINFEPSLHISNTWEAPYYASTVSALCIFGHTEDVLIFYVSGDVQVWNRKVNRSEMLSPEEVKFWGSETIVSPVGRSALVECYLSEGLGKRFALVDLPTGRLLRTIKCGERPLTSACYSLDGDKMFWSCQDRIFKATVAEPESTEEVWTNVPEENWVISGILPNASDRLSVYREVWNESTGIVTTIEYTCEGGKWGPEVRRVQGRVFDAVLNSAYEAFYCKKTGLVTIIQPKSGTQTTFHTERDAIMGAMVIGSEEYRVAQEVLRYPGEDPDVISLSKATLSPDGKHCLFVMSSSPRRKGLLVSYSLDSQTWSALAIGGDDAGGMTSLAWPSAGLK